MTTSRRQSRSLRRQRFALSSLGWDELESPQRSFVELASAPTWTVARVWSTDAILRAKPLPPGSLRVIIGVDGTAMLDSNAIQLRLEPQKMLLLPGSGTATTQNHGLWARIEWQIESAVLGRERLVAHYGKPVSVSAADYALLTAMTNVISTSPSLASSHGAGTLLDALAAVVQSTLLNSTETLAHLTPAQAATIRRAYELTDLHHTDSTFTVARLAASMSVSVSHLHHTIALGGTTPRQLLENRRVTTATALQNAIPRQTKSDAEEIALRSGFSSARALRTATRRQRDTP